MAKLSRINARQAAAMVEMAEKQGTVDEKLIQVLEKLDEALNKIDALTEEVAALKGEPETTSEATSETGASKSRKTKSEE